MADYNAGYNGSNVQPIGSGTQDDPYQARLKIMKELLVKQSGGQPMSPSQIGGALALAEGTYKNASEALASGQPGMDKHIEQQLGFNLTGMPTEQDTQNILQNLLKSVPQQEQQQAQGTPQGSDKKMPSVVQPQNAFTQPGVNPETGDIQKGGWVIRALLGLASGGVPGMVGGMAGPSATGQIAALKQTQTMAGREQIQPVQQAEVDLKKKIGEFLNQGAQVMTIDPTTNQPTTIDNPNAIRIMSMPTLAGPTYIQLDKNQDLNTELKSLTDLLDLQQKARTGWQKFFNLPSMQEKETMKNISPVIEKLNRRTGVSKQKQPETQNKSTFKVLRRQE